MLASFGGELGDAPAKQVCYPQRSREGFPSPEGFRRTSEILDLADPDRHKCRTDETAQEARLARSPKRGSCRSPGFHTEDALADSSLNPEERFAKSERGAILRDAVARLRPSIQKVIEVHQLQECSLHETAEVLGISVAAAKARMFHARAALRRARQLQVVAPSISAVLVSESIHGYLEALRARAVFSAEAQ